jgi:CBS domain containing-hemolysin-like protein
VARPEIEVLGGGRVRVEGGASLEDLLEQFELGDVEESDEYDTVAGYVIGHLGRIPSPGERVEIGRAELEVIETQDQRVTRLELRLDGATAGGTSQPVLDGERDSR